MQGRDMKFRHRVRNWVRRKSREAFHRIAGVAPPTHSMTSQEWIAEHPGDGSRTVLSGAQSQRFAARKIGGSVEEIDLHFDSLDDDRRSIFQRHVYEPLIRELPADVMVCLRDACVGCRGVAAISSDGILLSDLSAVVFQEMSNVPLNRTFEYAGYLPPLRRLQGTLGVLSYAYANQNYFHFLLECLPKIRLLEESGVVVDRYYVPYKQIYQQELLELFGIDRGKVIAESDLCFVQADEVYFPSHSDIPRKESVRFLFETAKRQSWAKLESGVKKRVYVSRSRMKRRNCLNDDDVMTMLSKYGFERYHLETMSVREQIQLFQQAEIIVGPHGAGLVNMVFSTPGTMVVEIGTPFRPYSFFHDLSMASDHVFRWFVASPTDGKGDESNMIVDVPLLESFLKQSVLEQGSFA
ncbi:glycosyltransferase family 61 protein [Bremerella sp. T1]|uniref:glycosyltransferase family 61 protein n=1 Tax=Bremerella sp. TYQ1 TaxID=3119568 RepID=UPI001CCC5831|nr:glycosyltransferase 61 family protein [Bremerella volcania]UBM36866.1 glycosyltransferase family 61 protein [Bremerella volcania]